MCLNTSASRLISGYWLDECDSFPGVCRKFSLIYGVQKCWVHPASNPMMPGVKRPERNKNLGVPFHHKFS
jgi:hypothetical protein